MKKFNTESLGDLEKGIKQLLMEDHYSFSEKETDLLHDCVEALQLLQETIKQTGKPDLLKMAKVVDTVVRICMMADHFKDLF